jgi:tRNA U34 5-methylaminomethyl-2-thiouridine-forming methyltransferase MnmC
MKVKCMNGYRPLTISKNVLKIVKKCFKDENEGKRNSRYYAKYALSKFLVKTGDGSYTLKSENSHGNSETMHTYHGAITESLEKFVKPCGLKEKSNIRILDICSGLGYNSACCIEFLEKKDINIKIDMIEISINTLAAALLIPNPIKSYQIVKKVIEDNLYEIGTISSKFVNQKIPDNISIEIFHGDAREVIKNKIKYSYDAIFLDPFSPNKSPELYTIEFFRLLKKILKKNGILSTYTSAAPVRSALIQEGFHIGEGPPFGRKNGGTIASSSAKNIKKSLSTDDERMIALSDVGVPYRDPKLNDSGIGIIKRRINERNKVRNFKKLPSTLKTPLYLCKNVENTGIKRRILTHLKKLGIDDLRSKKSKFIICPQFEHCICGCGESKFRSSYYRIKEMERRLSLVIGGLIEL